MLEFPRWKYALVATVMLLALLFALPNFFGTDPALQVARKNRLPMDEFARRAVEQTLTTRSAPCRASDRVEVRFVVTDFAGADFTVVYAGILPDLFREGKGVLATGRLGGDGVFKADEVLAKHDENYMPPELKGMKQS